jgi:hypothetical protein
VLITALIIDSVGNGLFISLSLVFFTALTEVPDTLLEILTSATTAISLPIRFG